MSKKLDLIGARFGRLVVVARAGFHASKNGQVALWFCACDCGTMLTIRQPYLRCGDTKSCGCFRSEVASNLNRSHSLAHKDETYDTWVLMRQRCNNTKASGYKYYGGVGISVCERWGSYENFFADMGRRPLDKPTIDRIDPYGNYEPSNCRWASWKDQAANKKRHHTEIDIHASIHPTNTAASQRLFYE